jgi:hypothetical protein
MIILGVSPVSNRSTRRRSLWVISPSARVILGDDVLTAGLRPVEGPYGASTSWRARQHGHPIRCHDSAITKVI